ncbi:MAG: YbaN family protein [Rikenellaceae bacterium]
MKLLLIALGTLSLTLGILGIILPLLPTTPFLLLSATLYMHSSPKLHNWLLGHRYLGGYIRNYQEHRVIPLKVKIMSTSLLWITILSSIFTICSDKIFIQLLLLIIAICVTWHILAHKSNDNL